MVLESDAGAAPIFPRARDRIRALADAPARGAARRRADRGALAHRRPRARGPARRRGRPRRARRAAALARLRVRARERGGRAGRADRRGARSAPDSGLRASFSGEATLGRDYLAAIEEGGRRSGLATVALVAITLLAVYRAPLAALVSLATLGAALGVTFGAVTLAAQLGLPVAYQSRGFLVALLFGIGTDYCLLLFARVREDRRASAGDARPGRRGAAPHDARDRDERGCGGGGVRADGARALRSVPRLGARARDQRRGRARGDPHAHARADAARARRRCSGPERPARASRRAGSGPRSRARVVRSPVAVLLASASRSRRSSGAGSSSSPRSSSSSTSPTAAPPSAAGRRSRATSTRPRSRRSSR